MAGSMSSLPIVHSDNILIIYDGEGSCMRNRSNAMIPIQDIDIDARHGPLRRSTFILHPLARLQPIHHPPGEPGRLEDPPLSLQST